MKSPFALPAAALSTLTALATLALLSACGQPGPLYMPKPPARAGAATPAATPPAQSPVTPVNTATPPAPAAGTATPPAGSNSNNTQATPPSSSPASQQ